jgi:hypothetical protein
MPDTAESDSGCNTLLDVFSLGKSGDHFIKEDELWWWKFPA